MVLHNYWLFANTMLALEERNLDLVEEFIVMVSEKSERVGMR